MNESDASHGWRDFIIAIVVAVAFILIAIAMAGSTWNPTTGNAPDSGAQGCQSGDASGAGC